MKVKSIIVVLLGIMLVSGAVIYFKYKNGSAAIHEHAEGELYYCPMHPQIQSDKPGSCPICHMKLVKDDPSAADEAASNDHAMHDRVPVDLKDGQQQLIGVKTTKVRKMDLTKTIHAYGYVAHDLPLYEAMLEYINAWREFYAYVVRRPVRKDFDFDWKDYYTMKPNLGEWRSEDEYDAQTRLVKAEFDLLHMGLSPQQIAELREIKYGQPWILPDLLFFEEGQPIWIYAKIFEQDLGYITVGQTAKVTLPAYGDRTEGIIRTVSEIDPETRTVTARIEVPKYRGELHVNMYADIDILVDLNTGLVVPRQAVMDTGVKKIVFVETGTGSFEPRAVRTEREGDGNIIISQGLKEGETIAVAGNFLLDSESRLRAAIEGVNKSSSSTQAHAGH